MYIVHDTVSVYPVHRLRLKLRSYCQVFIIIILSLDFGVFSFNYLDKDEEGGTSTPGPSVGAQPKKRSKSYSGFYKCKKSCLNNLCICRSARKNCITVIANVIFIAKTRTGIFLGHQLPLIIINGSIVFVCLHL